MEDATKQGQEATLKTKDWKPWPKPYMYVRAGQSPTCPSHKHFFLPNGHPSKREPSFLFLIPLTFSLTTISRFISNWSFFIHHGITVIPIHQDV